ncbi:zinc ribbon domain-containing protein [Nitrosomonas sp.]|uniref:FmdB family zinc ribbon protein n=1 Tax=Nitrosomonas sp. TaxID=42353 RepID=UPI0026131EBB|nr:zinc ribbon domain-containing protein [Nitrosomonas sp.]MCW5601623.1 zinc ribbon domain-containing protein [Nitrosomonas sp.]
MPIYEYICRSCGLEKEHLQKMSDAPIEHCPECGSRDYIKQISAAGFQLKGSGWYVTDFKNKPVAGAKSKTESKSESKTESPAPSPATAE